MRTYNLEPQTVKVLKNGMFRVGQDLLGNLVGKRKLLFDMHFDESGRLLMRPTTEGPGWPATYSSPKQLSAMVSVGMFFRVNQRKPPKAGTLIKCEKMPDGTIVVILPQNGSNGNGHHKAKAGGAAGEGRRVP